MGTPAVTKNRRENAEGIDGSLLASDQDAVAKNKIRYSGILVYHTHKTTSTLGLFPLSLALTMSFANTSMPAMRRSNNAPRSEVVSMFAYGVVARFFRKKMQSSRQCWELRGGFGLGRSWQLARSSGQGDYLSSSHRITCPNL